MYWLELHDVPKAVSVYRELVTQAPDAPETAEAHVVLAGILESQYRDLRGAISEITAALARDPPTAPDLRYQVAKLYFELGDYQQAELEARTLIQKFPASPLADDGWMLVGQSLSMRDGMHGEAMTAYATLVERFPASELVPHALFELGKLRGESGDDAGAIQAWVQALERHPDPQVVQSAIARTRKRIAQTTPRGMGSRAAFQRPEPHRVAAGPHVARGGGRNGGAGGQGTRRLIRARGAAPLCYAADRVRARVLNPRPTRRKRLLTVPSGSRVSRPS